MDNNNKQDPNMKSNWQTITMLVVAAILTFIVVSSMNNYLNSKKRQELSYNEFVQMVEAGEVDSIKVGSTEITVIPKKGNTKYSQNLDYYVVRLEGDYDFVNRILDNNVVTNREKSDSSTLLLVLLNYAVPFLFLLFLMNFTMKRMGGGGIMGVGKSNAKMYVQKETGITFKDVAGEDEAKESLTEIVDFLHNPGKYTKIGAKLPKGALLVGPPGTGKTLLAKAVAGEAHVPFYSLSGSDFVEMFVGVGASRVRDLFVQGKKNAPCLIFIDEIDAVGRQRGAGLGGGHDEREQTLNQLLVEMDGFESNEGVILIAATNRPDVLDPALLRPGRFDRQVVVPTPDVKGRLKILEVHTRRTPLDKHVNLEVIARGTPGFSGAALENLVNEAALQAARLGQDTVFMRDFEYAKDKVLMGKERRSLILSDEEKRITAYHEGGHALVAKLLPGTDPVHKVTIIPRGRALGVTMQLPEGDRHGYSKAFLQNNLMVLLAGRVAEEIIFDTITTGAGNDIERATGMARKMVCEWGMSDVVGPMTIGEQGEEVFIGRDWGHARNYSEDTARIVDAEIKKLVETARENCHKLLQENINLLHALAKALLDRETITGDDIDLLVKGEPLPPFDADGSAAKQEPAAPAPASADAGGETFKLEAEPSQDGGTGEKTQDETKQQ